MSEKQIKKIILAYSGGLDTTVILHWLKDQYDAEVIAFTADIGQDHDPELVRSRAASIGASKIIIEDLKEELKQVVRKKIGPIATPDLIHFTAGLPKTRSGKIMRRILRKIAANEHDQLGDTSTLADPGVVDDLVNNRLNK